MGHNKKVFREAVSEMKHFLLGAALVLTLVAVVPALAQDAGGLPPPPSDGGGGLPPPPSGGGGGLPPPPGGNFGGTPPPGGQFPSGGGQGGTCPPGETGTPPNCSGAMGGPRDQGQGGQDFGQGGQGDQGGQSGSRRGSQRGGGQGQRGGQGDFPGGGNTGGKFPGGGATGGDFPGQGQGGDFPGGPENFPNGDQGQWDNSGQNSDGPRFGPSRRFGPTGGGRGGQGQGRGAPEGMGGEGDMGGGEGGDMMGPPQRPQMDARMLQEMQRGASMAIKGIGMAERQFARFAAKGCDVSSEVTAAIAAAKQGVADLKNLKPEDLEEGPPEALMALDELRGTIEEAMGSGQACMNLTPMRKQAVKQLKRWDKDCGKIERAAERNDVLEVVAAECRSAVDAATAALKAGDDAKAAGDPDAAEEAYQSIFEAGEVVGEAMQKMGVLKNAKQQVKNMTREVKDLQRKLKEAERKGFDVGNLKDGIDELKQAVIDYDTLAKRRNVDPEDLLDQFDAYQDLKSDIFDGFDEVFGTEHELEGFKGIEQEGRLDWGSGFNSYFDGNGGGEEE